VLNKFLVVVTLLLASVLFSCSDAEVDYVTELHQIAQQVNSKCPQLLDSETRLDGIKIIEPNTIVYKHTLVHAKVQDIDTQFFKKELWPGLLSDIKVSRDRQKLREHKSSVFFYYADKNNLPICTIKIEAKDYQ
jgi:hypothetical protein